MQVLILGSAAGGGFPQWNSDAPGCRRARAGDPAALPRTQAGLAISADGNQWILLNASPDLREQLNRTPKLHPRDGMRSSPIAAVVLSGGDVDAIAGLLTLRERHAFTLLATPRVHGFLDANPIFDVLGRDIVARQALEPNAPATAYGCTLELFAVPGKVPLFLEEAGTMPTIQVDETTVGVLVSDGRHRLFYIPGCAAMTNELASRLNGADMVFFDGTLWRDDEMVAAKLGSKTGRRMGHMSLSGPDGTLAAFQSITVRRKIIIHMNNSNPVLLADSPERAEAEAAGWIIAEDGMEFSL
ncbi:pyrroloquinoline quinone biosynthesis protein B [Novosphingobium chloroacetimidivorans]|uniref:Coenzyme PQQ synthesis protein B n=1 Tax=Novosphingobium chloroacetimidivorans TaxID=1428314 RepID=A0A7W7NWU4_9SPHN|nr:pyrroloquinoline quinone biosynthesis protein PqqB [Novosphingobium chloroacetimidivorans]MBB4858784.1 pyrroloquinoline quinone biosynthesis protein B [Novosphingobium chloroacetimidivorans]